MSTVSKMQQVLGSLSNARADGKSAPAISRLAGEPSFAKALQNAKVPAWDPHEVWLNRVKKPREQRSPE